MTETTTTAAPPAAPDLSAVLDATIARLRAALEPAALHAAASRYCWIITTDNRQNVLDFTAPDAARRVTCTGGLACPTRARRFTRESARGIAAAMGGDASPAHWADVTRARLSEALELRARLASL